MRQWPKKAQFTYLLFCLLYSLWLNSDFEPLIIFQNKKTCDACTYMKGMIMMIYYYFCIIISMEKFSF